MADDPAYLEVYRSSRGACVQLGLALEAGGIPYGIHEAAGAWTIVVAAEDAARARSEIEAYVRENLARPAAVDAEARQPGNGWVGVIGYAAVLVLLAILQHQHQEIFASDWFDAGKIDAGRVRRGELWRTVTALSLHADLAHLLANVVIGGLLGLFAGQLLGSGFAWISILMAGAFGNLLAAVIRPAGHTSVGASTAVFAALGLVAAYGWILRRKTRAPRFLRYAPIIGGVVLLSYLGTGGERTDVLAHVTGFLSGLMLGAVYGKLANRLVFGRAAQIAMGIGAVAIVALAWGLALGAQSR